MSLGCLFGDVEAAAISPGGGPLFWIFRKPGFFV
jgi:hypothetical protein